ncbi:MAG: hypothetical protein GY888_06780 [Planctomycetaceae bacterium]|nr:hypothetical protein [Planctomycetaceae bacterium]
MGVCHTKARLTTATTGKAIANQRFAGGSNELVPVNCAAMLPRKPIREFLFSRGWSERNACGWYCLGKIFGSE